MKITLALISFAVFVFGGDAAYTFYEDPDNTGTIMQEIMFALIFILGMIAFAAMGVIDAIDRLIEENRRSNSIEAIDRLIESIESKNQTK